MSESRCEMSDLPVSQCGMECHRPVEKPKKAVGRTGFRRGSGIEAQFSSSCPECGDDIEVGDLITQLDGRYVHKECP